MQRIYPSKQFGIELTEPQPGLLPDRGASVIRSWAQMNGTYEYTSHVRRDEVSSLSSMDSDLEAFSHNPADGSIAPMAVQPGAYTNYLTQRFLSY
jgi:hypothetical protein